MDHPYNEQKISEDGPNFRLIYTMKVWPNFISNVITQKCNRISYHIIIYIFYRTIYVSAHIQYFSQQQARVSPSHAFHQVYDSWEQIIMMYYSLTVNVLLDMLDK